MIRFCDKDVFCVSYDMLSRSALLTYFLDEHRKDLVCVMDETGKYLGMITYSSLLGHNEVQEAILYQSVTLDENIWKNGRNYFKNKDSIDISNGDLSYLPVIDQANNLLYFIYQDDEANKEVRMLWELIEGRQFEKRYLSFSDIYPEYTCVTIHGCNELAWYFVEYLKSIGMHVNVEGEIWKQLGEWEYYESVDYRNFQIYAEGTWPKEKNMLQYMLRSVSVEFECIDKIYEANIKAGLIQDAQGDFKELLKNLQQEKEIVILGTDRNCQDAYDLLFGHHIDICCFYSLDPKEQQYFLLGKPVMNMNQIISNFNHPVFIECGAKHSAWGGGVGDIDRLAYIGYRRNKHVFFLQDYIEIPKNQIRNILNAKRLVLAGNKLLCQRLKRFFTQNNVGINNYYIGELDETCITIHDEELCLIVEPMYYYSYTSSKYGKWQDRLEKFMSRNHVLCYTGYFSADDSYLEMEVDTSRYLCSKLRPKGIIIGAIRANSGNNLFRDILDGHPNILKMGYEFLNNNLYFICLMLAEKKASEILEEFWILYNKLESDQTIREYEFPEPDLFSEKMNELLSERDQFTSQELFVILHIAYSAMYGLNKSDVKEIVIYHEPHFVDRNLCTRYAIWLKDENVRGSTVIITRNACIKAGSILKERIKNKTAGWDCLWNSVDVEKKEIIYDCWNRINIKFEDLKCHPRDIISNICEETGILWSDTLLDTTLNGKKVHRPGNVDGFDLKPVYDNYEDYFSEYDRMRICMFNYLWQKKYDYPYVSCMNFSAKELQEILLKEYRFENVYNFANNEVWILYKIEVKRRSYAALRDIRRVEILEID